MTDKMFMEVQDVTEMLNISEGKAYEIIRMLNAELKEKGYIVVRGQSTFLRNLFTTRSRRKKCQFTKMKKETVGM